VCRRLLGPSPDAGDAFQATFVVLATKAHALADGRPLGPWLHKVARDTAARARARSARRRRREAPLSAEPAAADLSRRLDRLTSARTPAAPPGSTATPGTPPWGGPGLCLSKKVFKVLF
jgi:DNA-directed RNA polymerase specialized sigma24 family protein